MVDASTIKQIGIVLVGAVAAAALSVGLFGAVPLYTGLGALEVGFGLVAFIGLLTLAARIAASAVSDYKDTPSPWRDLQERERDYYQGLIDDFYDLFVETVAGGREMDPETARGTEARVYLGTEAHEQGLVDHCGPRSEMEDLVGERIGVDDPTFETFEPEQRLPERIGVGARKTARAFGAGIASVLVDDETDVRF